MRWFWIQKLLQKYLVIWKQHSVTYGRNVVLVIHTFDRSYDPLISEFWKTLILFSRCQHYLSSFLMLLIRKKFIKIKTFHWLSKIQRWLNHLTDFKVKKKSLNFNFYLLELSWHTYEMTGFSVTLSINNTITFWKWPAMSDDLKWVEQLTDLHYSTLPLSVQLWLSFFVKKKAIEN